MSELRRVELMLAENLTPVQQAKLGVSRGLVIMETKCSKPTTSLRIAQNGLVGYLAELVKKS